MKKNRKQTPPGLSRRLRFPEDERRLPWLAPLLDAFAIVDTGVAVAVRNAEKREGKKLACGKGCGACCVHQKDLPLYPHEIVGVYWYVSEKMPASLREGLQARLGSRDTGQGCPFLIDDACAIHPVRPFGCRQFNVFTAPCAPAEDPYYTRRDDVLQPIPEYLDRAFAAVIPLYSGVRGDDAAGAIRVIRAQIMNLLSYNWSKLAEAIEKAAGTAK